MTLHFINILQTPVVSQEGCLSFSFVCDKYQSSLESKEKLNKMNHSQDFGKVTWAGANMMTPSSWRGRYQYNISQTFKNFMKVIIAMLAATHQLVLSLEQISQGREIQRKE